MKKLFKELFEFMWPRDYEREAINKMSNRQKHIYKLWCSGMKIKDAYKATEGM